MIEDIRGFHILTFLLQCWLGQRKVAFGNVALLVSIRMPNYIYKNIPNGLSTMAIFTDWITDHKWTNEY